MIIKTFVEPPIDNNNYLIIDETTGEAALVDCSSPGIWNKVPYTGGKVAAGSVGEHREEIDNVVLKYILLTHGHFDHIAGIKPKNAYSPESKQTESPKIYMHEADMDWVKQVNTYMPMMGMPEIAVPEIDVFINDGDIIKLGNLEIKVLHTPGHTQGGVCYYVGNSLFSGDTIFREAVGRCDLPGGNFDRIVESIENKIYKLLSDGRKNTTCFYKKYLSYLKRGIFLYYKSLFF